jgi:hypothetical protein
LSSIFLRLFSFRKGLFVFCCRVTAAGSTQETLSFLLIEAGKLAKESGFRLCGQSGHRARVVLRAQAMVRG